MKKTDRENKRALGGVLHILGNVVGIALIAVLLPIMAVNMTLIIKSYTSPEKVPTVFGVAPLIVQSGSMEPVIQVNDLILTKTVDAAKLKEQDIIAFQPPGVTTVVTHRIIEVVTEDDGIPTFRTKGDWNNVADVDPVYSYQVVGLYFQRFPGIGRIAEELQKPISMVVFVAIPLALFLLYDLLRRYLYNKKHKGEKTAEQVELERLRALAAALEAGEVPEMPLADMPAAAPAYPPIEGEPEIGEAAAETDETEEPEPEEPEVDIDEDDADEV